MDYFDPFGGPGGDRAAPGAGRTRFLLVSFDSDWRFGTSHAREIVRELEAARVPVTSARSGPVRARLVPLPVPEYHRTVAGYIDRLAAEAEWEA